MLEGVFDKPLLKLKLNGASSRKVNPLFSSLVRQRVAAPLVPEKFCSVFAAISRQKS